MWTSNMTADYREPIYQKATGRFTLRPAAEREQPVDHTNRHWPSPPTPGGLLTHKHKLNDILFETGKVSEALSWPPGVITVFWINGNLGLWTNLEVVSLEFCPGPSCFSGSRSNHIWRRGWSLSERLGTLHIHLHLWPALKFKDEHHAVSKKS